MAKYVLLVLLLIFLAAQMVRPSRMNPPVDPARELRAPANVQQILDRSCIDCHSNRTTYPWYEGITPINWYLADHIKEGRHELNFSEFAGYKQRRMNKKFEEICEQVEQ